MHAKNLLVNEGARGQAVEAVGEVFPHLHVIASLDFVVETVDSIDLRALVVAAEQEKVLGVLDLVAEQQNDCLQRLSSTVDVVTHEEVV